MHFLAQIRPALLSTHDIYIRTKSSILIIKKDKKEGTRGGKEMPG